MLLAVDVGNTNIVLGLFEDGADGGGADGGGADGGGADGAAPVHEWRMRTDARMTADEMAFTVRGLLAEHAGRVTGVSALSTVPAVLRELRMMLERYWGGVPTVVVEPGVRTGVPLLYDNPREVGADRIVNTLAAFTLYGGPAVVVDFGTSTNFDVVGARGEFLGGALAPGIEISVDALAARAAQLVKVQLVRPRSVIGKSTVEALQSGLLYGFAGQVDGMVRRIVAELAPGAEDTVAVVATGGLAPLVIAETETLRHHAPHLTLHGLRMVYAKNRP